ncbi:hypothetical protein, partial [Staphylococcus aureus]
ATFKPKTNKLFRSNLLFKILPLAVFFFCSKTIAQPPASVVVEVDSLNKVAFQEKKSDVWGALEKLYKAQNKALLTGYNKGLAISYM